MINKEYLLDLSQLELDRILYRNKDEESVNFAINKGIESYHNFYDSSLSLKGNLAKLGIVEVRKMNAKERFVFNCRSYYFIDEKIILYNLRQTKKIQAILKDYEFDFSIEEILNMQIAHELYHHLEEHYLPLKEYDLILRDIAAQSFAYMVNKTIHNEIIDILWIDSANEYIQNNQ